MKSTQYTITVCQLYLVLNILPLRLCDGTEIFKKEINGIEFGNVSLLYNDQLAPTEQYTGYPFTYITHDKDHFFLVATAKTLFKFDVSTETIDILGGLVPHLRKASNDTFPSTIVNITGLLKPPNKTGEIWIMDAGRNCFQRFERYTRKIEELTGKCNMSSVADGNFDAAAFGRISAVTKDPTVKNSFYFYDNTHKLLRRLYYAETEWKTESLVRWSAHINGVAVDPAGEGYYVTRYSDVWRRKKTGGVWKGYVTGGLGFDDGPLDAAKVNRPTSLLFINNETLIMADYGNYKLRLIDLKSSLVTSICQKQESGNIQFLEGDISNCRLKSPASIAKHPTDNYLLIVAATEIYKLPYEELTQTADTSASPKSEESNVTTLLEVNATAAKEANVNSYSVFGNIRLWFTSNMSVATTVGAVMGCLLLIAIISASSFLMTRRREPPVLTPVGANPANMRYHNPVVMADMTNSGRTIGSASAVSPTPLSLFRERGKHSKKKQKKSIRSNRSR